MTKDYEVRYYYTDIRKQKCIYMKDKDNEVYEMDVKEFYWIETEKAKYHNFRLLDGYDNTPEDLKKFKKDFNLVSKELLKTAIKTKSNKYFGINYKKFHSHNDAVYYNWKQYVKKSILDMFEKIDRTEFYILERNYNAGLITLNLDY